MATGDLETFEAATLPHIKVLQRTAAALLGNRSEADDAVQETYLQAWKSFQRFQPGTNCRAWLFKILFHVVSHQRRKWYRRFAFLDSSVMEETLAGSTPVAEDLTDEEILAALRQMPQPFAEVVLLADVQEFSYKEIQEALGIPIGTVMSRLSRGRQWLRARLAHRAAAIGIRSAGTHLARAAER